MNLHGNNKTDAKGTVDWHGNDAVPTLDLFHIEEFATRLDGSQQPNVMSE